MNLDCINGVEIKKSIVYGRENTKWRKELKCEWKRLQKKEIIYPNAYLTDVDRWICSCKYFLTSRFMICKHLIHLKGSVYKNYFKKVCDLII